MLVPLICSECVVVVLMLSVFFKSCLRVTVHHLTTFLIIMHNGSQKVGTFTLFFFLLKKQVHMSAPIPYCYRLHVKTSCSFIKLHAPQKQRIELSLPQQTNIIFFLFSPDVDVFALYCRHIIVAELCFFLIWCMNCSYWS